MTSGASRFLRSGAVVSAGAMSAYAARFLRNIALAHLLTQADFGVCVAMTSLISSALWLTDFGFEKLLIQEREIDDARLQPVLATLALIRMGVASLIVICLSWPLAKLLGLPQAASSFQILGLSLLPWGLVHLDTTRFQKYHRFGPDAAVNAAYTLLDCVFATIAALVFRSYVVLPYSLLASTTCVALLSHWLSERPYRLAWDRAIVERALRFGLPLMAVGFIMMAASQADRFIVGGALGLKDLALYGAVMAMVATPTMLLAKISTSLFLPNLAEASGNEEWFLRRFALVGTMICLAAVALLIPVMVLGRDLVTLVFGARYSPRPELIWVITLGQAAFFVRTLPNIAALARGDTKNVFWSNVFRATGLAMALIALRLHLGLVAIAAAFAAGELVALLGALVLLLRLHRQLLRGVTAMLAATAAAFLFGAIANSLLYGHIIIQSVAAACLVAGLVAYTFMNFSEARDLVLQPLRARPDVKSLKAVDYESKSGG